MITKHLVEPVKGVDGRYRYIYKITNTIDQKIYVGKHIVKANLTPYNDRYSGNGTSLRAAYKQCGKQAFVKEIIEYCSDDESLNEAERKHIAALFESNVPTYNVAPGGEGATRYAIERSVATTKRKAIVLFEFISKYNGKHFKKGHIFESGTTAGLQIGFKNPSTFSTNIMYNKSHPGIWVDVHNDLDWFTAFVFEDELTSYSSLDEAAKVYQQRYLDWRKTYDELRTQTLSKSQAAAKANIKKKVRCLNTFTSHLNGRTFEQGHVFESLDDANNSIGFKRRSLFSQLVVYNKDHPMQMYRKTGRTSAFVAAFEFVDNQ